MSLKTHEVMRLWRLPASGPASGPSNVQPAATVIADAFELVLDPSSSMPAPTAGGPPSFRPVLTTPGLSVEVSIGATIQSIIAQLKAQGSTESEHELMSRARFHEPGIDLERLRVGTILRFEPLSARRAPTQAELVKSPIVRDAVEAAWRDSKVNDPSERHEEGGWIYMNRSTGQVFTHRAPSGSAAGVDLRHPVAFIDAVVVGTFHTHPNPLHANYDLGPSDSDRNWDYSRGVPGLVRSELGYHTYGWERRRLDLEGPWAYPGTPENDLSGDPPPVPSNH